MKMNVAVYTLGCKLNQCESEALASTFERQGFFIVSPSEKADIYIINTCTVTSKAEQKARRMIRKFSTENPESIVIVTGCYAQLNKDDLYLGSNVVVLSNDDKYIIKDLPEYLKNTTSKGLNIEQVIKEFQKCNDKKNNRFWFESVNFNYHTRAFLKIQDGCNNSCAYCRVTLARGDSVSLDSESVISQYLLLHKQGFQEVVLTGINLASYYSEGIDFCGLLKKLIALSEENKNMPRIRLSSIEPEAVTSDLAEVLKNKIICPHFHIPVQSGSDKILLDMKRRNDRSQIITAVNLLRNVRPESFIAADVITGFPGEEDGDFLLTKTLLGDCDFSYFHVFPFSPRPGTLAEKMKPKIPERISRERTKVLRSLSLENYTKYLNLWKDRELEVLIEGERDGLYLGISENYLKCLVYGAEIIIGKIYKVIVDGIEDQKLVCKLICKNHG